MPRISDLSSGRSYGLSMLPMISSSSPVSPGLFSTSTLLLVWPCKGLVDLAARLPADFFGHPARRSAREHILAFRSHVGHKKA